MSHPGKPPPQMPNTGHGHQEGRQEGKTDQQQYTQYSNKFKKGNYQVESFSIPKMKPQYNAGQQHSRKPARPPAAPPAVPPTTYHSSYQEQTHQKSQYNQSFKNYKNYQSDANGMRNQRNENQIQRQNVAYNQQQNVAYNQQRNQQQNVTYQQQNAPYNQQSYNAAPTNQSFAQYQNQAKGPGYQAPPPPQQTQGNYQNPNSVPHSLPHSLPHSVPHPTSVPPPPPYQNSIPQPPPPVAPNVPGEASFDESLWHQQQAGVIPGRRKKQRIDPKQMPRPKTVFSFDQANLSGQNNNGSGQNNSFQSGSNFSSNNSNFQNNSSASSKVVYRTLSPKLPPSSCSLFRAIDEGSCSPRFVRPVFRKVLECFCI